MMWRYFDIVIYIWNFFLWMAQFLQISPNTKFGVLRIGTVLGFLSLGQLFSLVELGQIWGLVKFQSFRSNKKRDFKPDQVLGFAESEWSSWEWWWGAVTAVTSDQVPIIITFSSSFFLLNKKSSQYHHSGQPNIYFSPAVEWWPPLPIIYICESQWIFSKLMVQCSSH